MTVADGNVGVAFSLVSAAGAATIIGSSVVFFPSLVKRASRRVLAASLGLAAGVMIYVSFVEIVQKSVVAFVKAGMSENNAYIYTTLSFFGGVVFMKIVDICVRRLSGDHSPRRRNYDEDIQIVWNEDEGRCEMNAATEEQEVVAPHCVGCSDDPVGELKEWHRKAELELKARQELTSVVETNETCAFNEDEENGITPRASSNGEGEGEESTDGQGEEVAGTPSHKQEKIQKSNTHDPNNASEGLEPILVLVENVPRSPGEDSFFRTPERSRPTPEDEKKKLVKMGLSTGVAIALHNFPEGLATFVAALDDPSVGAVLAIAIGIHNIPEGLCVSLPIYYATNNRWKAFMWGCLSGATEPFAAILGWLVLANATDDRVYAVLFGLVGGMMVMISLKELIPTAHTYDPEDTVVTYSIIVGMAILALSLVLFKTSA